MGTFFHNFRRTFENFIADILFLGAYFVEVVGRAKAPAYRSLTHIDQHIRHFHQRTDHFMALVAGGIVLIAMLL